MKRPAIYIKALFLLNLTHSFSSSLKTIFIKKKKNRKQNKKKCDRFHGASTHSLHNSLVFIQLYFFILFFPTFHLQSFFFLLNTNSNQLSVSEIACGVLSKKQYSTTIMGGRDDLVAFSSSEVLFYFLFMKGRFKGMTMEQRTQVLS